MPGKPVSASAVNEHIYKVFPNDLNARYTMFGGRVMAIADRLALVVSERHSGRTCVTVAIDHVHFLGPAQDGDTLVFRTAINRAWTTSMEIGVRVEAENSRTSVRRHIVSAYFTFVALGADGKPCRVSGVRAETEVERRRYEQAALRRRARLKLSS